MSIYRTLLEEDEINVIDNEDNDGFEEVKDLMEVIDDGEINMQEVEDAADAEFGPDEDVEDIMDEFCLLIAESESAWNLVLEGIGIRELNEAVQGINEEKIDMESVKSFFGGLKEKVVNLYNKVIGTIKKYAESAMAAVKFNLDFVAKNREAIIDGAKSGVSVQGYPYSGMKGAAKYFNANPLTKTKAYKLAMGGDEALNSARYDQQDRVADLQKVISALTGGKVAASSRSYKKEMVAYLRGGTEKVAVKASGKDIIAVLEDKEGMIKAINDAQNSAKEECKEVVKALHKLEKSYAKAAGREKNSTIDRIGTGAMKSYGIKTKGERKYASADAAAADSKKNRAAVIAQGLNNVLSVSTIAKGTILKMVKEQAQQARKLANACIKASKKGSKGIEESFEYGYLSDLNLI